MALAFVWRADQVSAARSKRIAIHISSRPELSTAFPSNSANMANCYQPALILLPTRPRRGGRLAAQIVMAVLAARPRALSRSSTGETSLMDGANACTLG